MFVSLSSVCYLEILRDMFPSKSDTDINVAIRNAHGDLDVAIEALLSGQCELDLNREGMSMERSIDLLAQIQV